MINEINRRRDIPDNEDEVPDGIFLELLWNDPVNQDGWGIKNYVFIYLKR